MKRILIAALVAAAVVAPASFGRAQDGAVTVRIVGADDGKGTFTAKGGIVDGGMVRRYRAPARLRFVATGLKGTITFVVTTNATPATWKILTGTKTYKGLFGHGTMKTNAKGSLVTLVGKVERPRQPQ